MANDLNEITIRINRWLRQADLPVDGVRIVLEFPSKASAMRAEAQIKMETEPMLAYANTGGTFGKIETMNGLGLSLRVRAEQR